MEYKPKSLFDKTSAVATPREDFFVPKPLFTNNPVSKAQENNINKVNPLFGGSTPAKVVDKTVGPKVMFGGSKIRKRIELKIEDLKYNATPEHIKEAHQLIISTNVDDINYEYVLNWGAEIQRKHQEVLDYLLNTALDKEATAAKGEILKLIQLINGVDFEAFNKTGLFQGSKESKLAKMKDLIGQVQSVSSGLLTRLDSLKADWRTLTKVDEKIKQLSVELEPFIISCDFFSNYTKDNFPTALFLSRLTSLMSTKVTLLQNLQQQEMFERDSITLIDAIQGTIRTEIPMWQNNYINVLTNGSGGGIVGIQQEKETILSKLKKII